MSKPVKNFPRLEEELEGQGLDVLLAPYDFHFFSAAKENGHE
jgi:hypothetical protein